MCKILSTKKAYNSCKEEQFLGQIYDYDYALCDLVALVQFKKREKHPWRSVNFSKVAS